MKSKKPVYPKASDEIGVSEKAADEWLRDIGSGRAALNKAGLLELMKRNPTKEEVDEFLRKAIEAHEAQIAKKH